MTSISELIAWCNKRSNFSFYSFAPDDADENIFTSKTVEDITKIPQFRNLTSLVFQEFPEIFDINQFYDYIKVHF